MDIITHNLHTYTYTLVHTPVHIHTYTPYRSKTAPSPTAVSTTMQVTRAMTAIEQGTWSGDKEIHVKIFSDSTVPSTPGHGPIVPSPKAVPTDLSSPGHYVALVSTSPDMKVVPRPINSVACQGSVERLPHLPTTPSLVAATRKASGNSSRHQITKRSNQAIQVPSKGLATDTTSSRPAALDTTSSRPAALDTTSSTTKVAQKMSISSGHKATRGHARGKPVVKGNSYVNKQKVSDQ